MNNFTEDASKLKVIELVEKLNAALRDMDITRFLVVLKTLITLKGIYIRELSRMTGVPRTTLYSHLILKDRMSLRTLMIILKVLNLTLHAELPSGYKLEVTTPDKK